MAGSWPTVMPMHNYERLSPQDFENLAADVLGAQENIRFEVFTEGPDGGIDLRHVAEDGTITLGQAKRIANFHRLFRAAQDERDKLDRQRPHRYILVTSCALTPDNKDKLVGVLSPYLRTTGDILGRNELDALLSRHPQVLNRQFKLWMTDAQQLSSILHNAVHQLTACHMEVIRSDAERFVPHSFVGDADERLARHHCCVITGSPGVGKTALAGYLALRYAAERGHELHVVTGRAIRDVWDVLSRERPQLFILDDFLGANFLNEDDGLAMERDLVALIGHVTGGDGHHKLLMTTRDYVLEQARWRLEKLDRESERLNRITVAMDQLDDVKRAEILCNHLFHECVPTGHLRELVRAKAYWPIVRHENFTPRLVQHVARDSSTVSPGEFPRWLLGQLNDPQDYWNQAFRRLSPAGQHLLYALSAAGGEAAAQDVVDLFHALHERLSNGAVMPDSMQEAARQIEPNFVRSEEIDGNIWLRFANPSIGDLVDGVVGRNPSVMDALTECFARFQHGLWLYRLHERAHPSAERSHLLERLADRIGDPALDRSRIRIDSRLEERSRRPGIGDRLSHLWRTAERANAGPEAVLPRIEQYVGPRAPWEHYFCIGDYGPLLRLLRYLPKAAQQAGWCAALEALTSTEDAAALAEAMQSWPEMAAFLSDRSAELSNTIRGVCDDEIEQSDDDDQVAQVLQDIEVIQDALGLDLNGVKYAAWERIETLRDEDAYSEADALEAEELRSAGAGGEYIEALFASLANDREEFSEKEASSTA